MSALLSKKHQKGYYNNPEATAKAIDKDGFYHTGDLCRILEDGTLVVYDRLRDQIKYRGNWFSPKEFEASLVRMNHHCY